jgi:pimeloyl-ACP methyl ester carboxylesterase
LLIWGDTDREVPLKDGERLHEAIPGSRLTVFRACGHLPHEEYPETFVKLVLDFCSPQVAEIGHTEPQEVTGSSN